ncbi:viroplasmin family protein [Oscillatoria sp. FACHB-1406]|nr:viroplasmin family protein [Oscillatoria sp. FACHB-1406]
MFTTWADCEQQVKGFSGAVYKSFKTRAEAESALQSPEQGFLPSQKPPKPQPQQILVLPSECIARSICVDASCLGNPGDVEYRGVDTQTGEEIFHQSPLPYGTNNLGEFLAIARGLAYLKERGLDWPIYSDSRTAMLWVKNRQVRTTLTRSAKNQEIFELIDRALDWLENNEYRNRILKWDTTNWGEIPADFGRK